jgi:shikimate kinase
MSLDTNTPVDTFADGSAGAFADTPADGSADALANATAPATASPTAPATASPNAPATAPAAIRANAPADAPAKKLCDHIIFIGFMGSGKSSIARRLARSEKMNCIDMDSCIERDAGMSVQEIFATEGEEGFRARELEFLRTMLIRDRSILSCGGGVIVREESRELLRELGTVVYLKVSAEDAVARISHPETRPLLAGKVPPDVMLASRLRYYEETADLTINTSGRSIHQVVSVVRRALRARGTL